MFLIAKSASAATAALGFAGYTLGAMGLSQDYAVLLAMAAVTVLTLVALGGIRRSNITNITIVSITLLSLLFFVIAGLPAISLSNFSPSSVPSADKTSPLGAFFHAAALMFVAYTGYGRIATLGEEVHDPKHTIPRAIIVTMVVTMALYIAVAAVGIGTVGAGRLSGAANDATSTQAAPLAVAARQFPVSFSSYVVAMGAVTAMLGVLLNLILGLSRVLLAMGRRRDMPVILERLNEAKTTPYWAVLVVGVVIAGLVLIGNVKTTWSFSAFTVLIYYALTNAAALRLPAQGRLYPTWVAGLGLLACLFLAFWVEPQIWLIGLGLIAAGLAWHAVARWRHEASWR